MSDIVGETTELCVKNTRKFLPLAALLFLPRPLLTILGLLGIYLNRVTLIFNSLTNIVILVAVPTLAFFYCWACLAMYQLAHKELSGQPESDPMGNSWKLLWPAAYTLALTLVLLFAGTILFLIPGIIFFVWYGLSLNALVADGKRGLAALKTSKQLVVGRFWAVAWRLIAPWFTFVMIGFLAEIILSFTLTAALSSEVVKELVGNILNALVVSVVTPFTIAATAVLYKQLKDTPHETPENTP